MKYKIFKIELIIAVILSLTFHQFAISADVHIYRGIGANSNGSVKLSPQEFKWTGNPHTTLSASDSTSPTLPIEQSKCYFRFSVSGNFSDPPTPKEQGNVTGEGLEGFTAIFDNYPQGHWSINHPEDISDDDAKDKISKYAKQNATIDNILNGGQNNCRPPKKLTRIETNQN